MKYLILLIFPLFIGVPENSAHNANVTWGINYADALSESKKSGDNILLYFTGSDWCAPCKILKQDLFETQKFRDLSKDYVLLYIDIPMKKQLMSSEQLAHNKSLLPRFNKKGVFPLLKVLDSNEMELDELAGYNMKGEIRPYLQLLKKHR